MGYPHYSSGCYEHWNIATICGSMRFYDQMLVVAERLTLEGWLVLMPFVRKGGQMAGANQVLQYDLWRRLARDADTVGDYLDRMHKRKIDLSRKIVVVSDESGYIGDSTRSEIEYARETHKDVEYALV